MSIPAGSLPHFASSGGHVEWDASDADFATPQKPLLPGKLASKALGQFKYDSENHERKWHDYALLGVLSLFVHTTVVQQFDHLSMEQEIIEPAKPLPKIQITLSRPQPKPIAPPPPVAQPKPPKPKVVPLKPQKPKPVPKVVEQTPAPEPTPIVNDAPPAPVSAPPAPPAPVIQEKITPPTAGADYLHNPAPEYPEIAQERGWEGKVLMKVHVQPNGKPDSVTVVKSSGQKVLDDAAVKTVYKWSFVPAKRGDTPIAGFVTVPISFNLS
ncbi:energy transducer TonB [Methylomonas rapida]|uniref:Protein TonB n=1 Tax=Methylomonas rapida TaxID=2963939 RepID=A0ABY7GQB2_9GAMM|nr:energy transducer TonB [Methylomonas rapida]WAR46676.1 energy transducer TonB [Methylomonas rapida]